MKIQYQIKDLNEIEKKEVEDMMTHHLRSYRLAEAHSAASGHNEPILFDLRIAKTDEKQGHCKYSLYMHCHLPGKKELIVKKEGFQLIDLMKASLESMDHEIDHTIDLAKEHRH